MAGTRAGADGRYRLYGVPQESYLHVRRPGYVPVTERIQIGSHTTRDFQLRGRRERPIVRGHLHDDRGRHDLYRLLQVQRPARAGIPSAHVHRHHHTVRRAIDGGPLRRAVCRRLRWFLGHSHAIGRRRAADQLPTTSCTRITRTSTRCRRTPRGRHRARNLRRVVRPGDTGRHAASPIRHRLRYQTMEKAADGGPLADRTCSAAVLEPRITLTRR